MPTAVGSFEVAELAQRAARQGRTVLEVAQEATELSTATLQRLLDPRRLCGDVGRSRPDGDRK